MKKAYLAISKSRRSDFDAEVEQLSTFLQKYHISLHVFVDNYQFVAGQEKDMMNQAFQSIDHSDLLIAEVSNKAIGVGIEVGYAFAKNKPIIYLKRKTASYSTTVAGSADYLIEYATVEQLIQLLTPVLTKLKIG